MGRAQVSNFLTLPSGFSKLKLQARLTSVLAGVTAFALEPHGKLWRDCRSDLARHGRPARTRSTTSSHRFCFSHGTFLTELTSSMRSFRSLKMAAT